MNPPAPDANPPRRLTRVRAFFVAKWKWPAGLGLLLGLAVLFPLISESIDASSPKDLTWPAPPNPARIKFVQSLTGPADLGIRRPFFGRVLGFIAGESRRDVLMRPLGIALDEDGNPLLTDTANGTVCWFDLKNPAFLRWEKIGPHRLASPVAVAAAKGMFFVADSELAAVLAFDAKGKLHFALTNDLQRPVGLAVAGKKLFVADTLAHRVVVFDLRGQRLSEFGRRGDGPGEFNFPTHLATDANGHLLVTDSMNSRVQILNLAGAPLGVIGSLGDGSGHFSRPKGVGVDSFGHVYVADALFDNVQIFDQQGQLLLHFGEAGQKPGEFWLPGGVAVGRDNRIYVADTYNRRVQIFQYVGPQ